MKTVAKTGVFFVVMVIFATLTGCSCLKQTVEVPVYIHDTTHTVKEVHDSTYIDRWHTIEIKGDSVFIHDSVFLFKYKTKTDTAYKVIERPITVTQTKTEYIEKPLGWWQKLFLWTGIICIAVLIGYGLWKTKNWWWELFKKIIK